MVHNLYTAVSPADANMKGCQAVVLCCLLLAYTCGAKQEQSSSSATGSGDGGSDVIKLTTNNIAEQVETQSAPALVSIS